ncbi:EscU/YscU/HrcU family type III secretion system export apparatus switch protein [Porticoccaceae bacterium LTM1]|nr:EscU/YscU/HrcU family type III secretion system export apparatus switch protein [Porticoccaceae bacterium LTM1]
MNRELHKKSPKLAAALNYDGVNTPRVVAKGEGQWADRIETLAREHDVPVQQDQLLSAALSAVPVGEEIPRQLYIAVAEVLSFVYFLKGKVPDGYQEKG